MVEATDETGFRTVGDLIMDDQTLPLPFRRGLSREQAADYLGIGVTLLSELDIPCIKLGRRCIYDRVDLDGWLDDT